MLPFFKRDTALIVGHVVVLLGLFGLFLKGALSWAQVLGAIALLQFPGLVGRRDAAK